MFEDMLSIAKKKKPFFLQILHIKEISSLCWMLSNSFQVRCVISYEYMEKEREKVWDEIVVVGGKSRERKWFERILIFKIVKWEFAKI